MSVKKKVDTQNREKGKLRVGKRGGGHAKRGKQEIACREKERRTRKKEKMRNRVSRKRKADTQKEKNKKLRVAEKKGGHAKREKWKTACRAAEKGGKETSRERETGHG